MKFLKKAVSFMAISALSLAFTACAGNGGSANAYTLVVKDSNGNAMSNYAITVCHVENGEKTTCEVPKTTDANGKVVFELAKGNYAVSDANPNDNISLQGEYYFTDYGTINVTVVVE